MKTIELFRWCQELHVCMCIIITDGFRVYCNGALTLIYFIDLIFLYNIGEFQHFVGNTSPWWYNFLRMFVLMINSIHVKKCVRVLNKTDFTNGTCHVVSCIYILMSDAFCQEKIHCEQSVWAGSVFVSNLTNGHALFKHRMVEWQII